MRDLIITLLTCSVTMSVISLFYLAITPLLSKRYSERGRYYVWLVIVLGLIIPFRPQWDNAIVKINVPAQTVTPITRNIDTVPAVFSGAGTSVPAVPARLNIEWWHIAAAVWLAGTAVAVVYHAIRHYRFMKTAKRWSESVTDEQTSALFHELKTEMSINKNINLFLCSSVGSPMIVGFIKPRILLPIQNLPRDELRLVLKHELTHYKRKDLYSKCLALLAVCVHWFNPIVYLVARAVDAACELYCDAEVVSRTGIDARRRYSEAIIGAARYQSKLKTSLSTNFYGGKKGMRKRIFSIMDTGKKKAGLFVVCAALIATLGTGFAFAASTESAPNLNSLYMDGGTATSTDANEHIIDAYLRVTSDYWLEKSKPYAHLGVSVDESAGLLMYDGKPVREIFDPVTSELMTETLGASGFYGRNVSDAVDLTVIYENGKPSGFKVSTQEEYDNRTEERRGSESTEQGGSLVVK